MSQWKLVPVEPTPEMVTAIARAIRSSRDSYDPEEEIYRAMLAAAPSAPSAPEQAGSGWQPIESAPRDGEYVLLLGPTRIKQEPMPFTGRWLHGVPGCWVIVNADLAVQRFDPTHWQPLPPPPDARRATPTKGEDSAGETR